MLLFAAHIYGCLCKYDVVTYLRLNVISCALNIDVLPCLCPLFLNHVGAPSVHIFVKVLLPDSEMFFSYRQWKHLLSNHISIEQQPSLRGVTVTFPDSQTAAYDEDTKGTKSMKTLAFWLYFSLCLDTYLNLALVQISSSSYNKYPEGKTGRRDSYS